MDRIFKQQIERNVEVYVDDMVVKSHSIAQHMVDFLAEFTWNDQTTPDWWSLYVDNASNMMGSGAWIILEGLDNVTLEQAILI